jgi:hypothetical protein
LPSPMSLPNEDNRPRPFKGLAPMRGSGWGLVLTIRRTPTLWGASRGTTRPAHAVFRVMHACSRFPSTVLAWPDDPGSLGSRKKDSCRTGAVAAGAFILSSPEYVQVIYLKVNILLIISSFTVGLSSGTGRPRCRCKPLRT